MKKEFLLWAMAPVLYLITTNTITGPWKLLLAFLSLLWIVVDFFLLHTAQRDRKAFDIILGSVLLVGATNWFFSPFFFLLYLLIISIAFVFSLRASIGFTVSLLVLFIFHVGEVDVAYDSLVLLSLLGTIAVASVLRKEYLKLQESQKRILILEQQAKEKHTTVEALLANVVTLTSAELRQPLVNIKNYSDELLTGEKDGKKTKEYLERIYESALSALGKVDRFDEQSTGRKLKST